MNKPLPKNLQLLLAIAAIVFTAIAALVASGALQYILYTLGVIND